MAGAREKDAEKKLLRSFWKDGHVEDVFTSWLEGRLQREG